MKHHLLLLSLCLLPVFLLSCEDRNTTYSEQLKAERQIIKDYIAREGIRVIYEYPEQWGDKDYYLVEGYDYFYFHLNEQGDTATTFEDGDIVLTRYKRFSLDIYPDTVSYWTTDDGGYPISFTYGNNQDENCCIGWQIAVKQCKHSEAVCTIICPNKLGFTSTGSDVIPYGYQLSFKKKR